MVELMWFGDTLEIKKIMNNITEQAKLELRNKAKLEIERMETIFKDVETLQLLDGFKNKFNLCESAYKIILSEHQKSKGSVAELKRLKLDMRQVPFALNFAGYAFNTEHLNELFGGKSKINGCKTVKNLRDSITHGINDECVDEIKERKEELFGYMDRFLQSIKTFDYKETIK